MIPSYKEQEEQYVSAIMQRLEQETAINGFCLDQELFIVPTSKKLKWEMFVLTNSGKAYIDERINDQQLSWLADYAYDMNCLAHLDGQNPEKDLPPGYDITRGGLVLAA